MYCSGLGLKVLASFDDHEGYDGRILGLAGTIYHFEFTYKRGQVQDVNANKENLIVIYEPNKNEFQKISSRMIAAGFKRVTSQNPYWEQHGQTFEDPEFYRIVISNQNWSL